jgi:NitT/TauT family transport system ATP-binding protein
VELEKDIYNSFNNQVTTRVWASLIVICIISIAFFYLITYIQNQSLINTDMAKNKSVIEIKDVSITYNDRKLGLKAIENLNLSVKNGEFISIVGPSGCGKSTVLKLISDTLESTFSEISGSVKVNGKNPDTARKLRKVGFVFQRPTLLQWRSVEKILPCHSKLSGLKRKEFRKKSTDC